MQEEVTQRTVALCVEATKLSAGMLQQVMKKVLDEMQKGVTGRKTKLHHGKQTLRQLMKHNTGVSNIEITDQNIRAFSATAKKYGIDFALKKDTSGEIYRFSLTPRCFLIGRHLSDVLLFWVTPPKRAAPPLGFQCSGSAKPPLRQGFGLRPKRLYAAKAARPRRAVGWYFCEQGLS